MSQFLLSAAIRLSAVGIAIGLIHSILWIERADDAAHAPLEPKSGAVSVDQPPPVYALEWSDCGSRLLAVCKYESRMVNATLFDFKSPLYDRQQLPPLEMLRRVVFVPGSDRLLAGNDHGRVWEIDPAAERSFEQTDLTTPYRGVVALRAMSQGRTAIAVRDELRMCNSDGSTCWRLSDVGGARNIWVTRDERFLIVPTNNSRTLVLNTANGRIERILPGEGAACAAELPGGLIACGGGDGRIVAWNVLSGTQAWSVRPTSHSLTSLAVSTDGLIAAGDWEGNLIVLDRDGRELDRTAAHTDALGTLSFSADGQRLATGGLDGRIVLWNPKTLERVETLQ